MTHQFYPQVTNSSESDNDEKNTIASETTTNNSTSLIVHPTANQNDDSLILLPLSGNNEDYLSNLFERINISVAIKESQKPTSSTSIPIENDPSNLLDGWLCDEEETVQENGCFYDEEDDLIDIRLKIYQEMRENRDELSEKLELLKNGVKLKKDDNPLSVETRRMYAISRLVMLMQVSENEDIRRMVSEWDIPIVRIKEMLRKYNNDFPQSRKLAKILHVRKSTAYDIKNLWKFSKNEQLLE